MTNEPTPETDAKLAAATEDSSATASPPSDWPAFARAEQDELNRQLSVALKGKRPYSSKFADETIASQVKRIVELEEKLNGWFSERNAARADVALITAENERLATGNHLMEKEIPELRHALDEVWAKLAECRAALEMIASADGATTPGTAAWASAEIARAALATLSK